MDVEVVSEAAVNALEKASIDMQIATAKRYPRVDVKQFLNDAKTMIGADLETAESCVYKLKRKEKDGTTKIIEGPSIRLLEIVANCWGNIRYGSRVIGMDGKFVTCQGVAHDLQKNVYVSVEIKRRITTKNGTTFGDDMIGVTSNAAGSIARRNALKGVIPTSYINNLADEAKQISQGLAKPLPERLQRAFDFFVKTYGVTKEQVLAYVEKPNVESCTIEDLELLNGLKTALKEGDETLEQAFPRQETAVDLGTKPSQQETKQEAAATTPTEEKAAPKKRAGRNYTLTDDKELLRKAVVEQGIEQSSLVAWIHGHYEIPAEANTYDLALNALTAIQAREILGNIEAIAAEINGGAEQSTAAAQSPAERLVAMMQADGIKPHQFFSWAVAGNLIKQDEALKIKMQVSGLPEELINDLISKWARIKPMIALASA